MNAHDRDEKHAVLNRESFAQAICNQGNIGLSGHSVTDGKNHRESQVIDNDFASKEANKSHASLGNLSLDSGVLDKLSAIQDAPAKPATAQYGCDVTSSGRGSK